MQGREAWARAALHSHTAFNETVTLLATAHELQEFFWGGGGWEAERGGDVKDSAGGGEGERERGEDWCGPEGWLMLYKWFDESVEGSEVHMLVYSLAPALLFTWSLFFSLMYVCVKIHVERIL
jgi:hypothetical protein